MAKPRTAERQSKYKYVYWHKNKCQGKDARAGWWRANVSREGKFLINKLYETEREAAKQVDLALIKAGYEPVNIFSRA